MNTLFTKIICLIIVLGGGFIVLTNQNLDIDSLYGKISFLPINKGIEVVPSTPSQAPVPVQIPAPIENLTPIPTPVLIPVQKTVFNSQKECQKKTGKSCRLQNCDYVPKGKTTEEVCGKDFKKGWLAKAATGLDKNFSYIWSDNLKLGVKNDANVEALQQALAFQGFYKGKIDGNFDDKTKKAVQKFQKKYKLVANGIVGLVLRAQLNKLYGSDEVLLVAPTTVPMSQALLSEIDAYGVDLYKLEQGEKIIEKVVGGLKTKIIYTRTGDQIKRNSTDLNASGVKTTLSSSINLNAQKELSLIIEEIEGKMVVDCKNVSSKECLSGQMISKLLKNPCSLLKKNEEASGCITAVIMSIASKQLSSGSISKNTLDQYRTDLEKLAEGKTEKVFKNPAVRKASNTNDTKVTYERQGDVVNISAYVSYGTGGYIKYNNKISLKKLLEQ